MPASSFARTLKLGNQEKLQAYGLFKQATSGPCTKAKPEGDMVAEMKWGAWKKHKVRSSGFRDPLSFCSDQHLLVQLA